nr:hypothetical transcript [Hymenolepis microstoma]
MEDSSITVPTNDSTTGSQKKEINSTPRKVSPRKRLLSKPRGKTCAFCSKKLTLIEGEMKCACGGTFCAKHQFSKDHNCVYDYRSMKKSLNFEIRNETLFYFHFFGLFSELISSIYIEIIICFSKSSFHSINEGRFFLRIDP